MSLIPPEPESGPEPAFMSMDLDSSLGVINDATTTCPCCSPGNNNDNNNDNDNSTTTGHSAQPGQTLCQSIDTSNPILLQSFGVLPILKENPNMNQKVTRTSLTYPFADKKKSSREDKDKDDDQDNIIKMDESEGFSSPPMSSFLEPIHLSDEAADLSMMMLLQDDETQEVLVNRIGGKGCNVVPNYTGARNPPLPIRKRSRDYQDDAMTWEGLDLIETEVEEEDDLFCLLEEEEVQMAKEGGFVLENIGDRQSFWNEQ